MSTPVMGGLTTLYTLFTVGAIYLFISRSANATWKDTSGKTKPSLVDMSLHLGYRQEALQLPAKVIKTSLYERSMRRNVSQKPILMRAMGQASLCPEDCTNTCNNLCTRKSLPRITSDRIPPTKTTLRPLTKPRMDLVCVFYAVRYNLWPKTYQCTSYVYIRNNRGNVTSFGPEFFSMDLSLTKADYMFNRARSTFPYANWYLGYSGVQLGPHLKIHMNYQLYIDEIHRFIRTEEHGAYLKISSFNGVAFINVPVVDADSVFRFREFVIDFQMGLPQLPLKYLYTLVLRPNLIEDTDVAHFLSYLRTEGTSVGVHINELAYNDFGAWFDYPDATLKHSLPAIVRSMQAMRRRFPPGFQFCMSISAHLYWQLGDVDVYTTELAPLSRIRIETPSKVDWSKDGLQVRNIYEEEFYHRYDEHAEERVFYDTAASLGKKLTDVLNWTSMDKRLGMPKCVVFDDIGEDSIPADMVTSSTPYSWKPYELLQTVVEAIQIQDGRPLLEPEYYRE